MSKQVSQMTAEEILGCRKWPAWFTVAQMRAQLEHEAKGVPAPFGGAKWNPIGYFE